MADQKDNLIKLNVSELTNYVDNVYENPDVQRAFEGVSDEVQNLFKDYWTGAAMTAMVEYLTQGLNDAQKKAAESLRKEVGKWNGKQGSSTPIKLLNRLQSEVGAQGKQLEIVLNKQTKQMELQFLDALNGKLLAKQELKLFDHHGQAWQGSRKIASGSSLIDLKTTKGIVKQVVDETTAKLNQLVEGFGANRAGSKALAGGDSRTIQNYVKYYAKQVAGKTLAELSRTAQNEVKYGNKQSYSEERAAVMAGMTEVLSNIEQQIKYNPNYKSIWHNRKEGELPDKFVKRVSEDLYKVLSHQAITGSTSTTQLEPSLRYLNSYKKMMAQFTKDYEQLRKQGAFFGPGSDTIMERGILPTVKISSPTGGLTTAESRKIMQNYNIGKGARAREHTIEKQLRDLKKIRVGQTQTSIMKGRGASALDDTLGGYMVAYVNDKDIAEAYMEARQAAVSAAIAEMTAKMQKQKGAALSAEDTKNIEQQAKRYVSQHWSQLAPSSHDDSIVVSKDIQKDLDIVLENRQTEVSTAVFQKTKEELQKRYQQGRRGHYTAMGRKALKLGGKPIDKMSKQELDALANFVNPKVEADLKGKDDAYWTRIAAARMLGLKDSDVTAAALEDYGDGSDQSLKKLVYSHIQRAGTGTKLVANGADIRSAEVAVDQSVIKNAVKKALGNSKYADSVSALRQVGKISYGQMPTHYAGMVRAAVLTGLKNGLTPDQITAQLGLNGLKISTQKDKNGEDYYDIIDDTDLVKQAKDAAEQLTKQGVKTTPAAELKKVWDTFGNNYAKMMFGGNFGTGSGQTNYWDALAKGQYGLFEIQNLTQAQLPNWTGAGRKPGGERTGGYRSRQAFENVLGLAHAATGKDMSALLSMVEAVENRPKMSKTEYEARVKNVETALRKVGSDTIDRDELVKNGVVLDIADLAKTKHTFNQETDFVGKEHLLSKRAYEGSVFEAIDKAIDAKDAKARELVLANERIAQGNDALTEADIADFDKKVKELSNTLTVYVENKKGGIAQIGEVDGKPIKLNSQFIALPVSGSELRAISGDKNVTGYQISPEMQRAGSLLDALGAAQDDYSLAKTDEERERATTRGFSALSSFYEDLIDSYKSKEGTYYQQAQDSYSNGLMYGHAVATNPEANQGREAAQDVFLSEADARKLLMARDGLTKEQKATQLEVWYQQMYGLTDAEMETELPKIVGKHKKGSKKYRDALIKGIMEAMTYDPDNAKYNEKGLTGVFSRAPLSNGLDNIFTGFHIDKTLNKGDIRAGYGLIKLVNGDFDGDTLRAMFLMAGNEKLAGMDDNALKEYFKKVYEQSTQVADIQAFGSALSAARVEKENANGKTEVDDAAFDALTDEDKQFIAEYRTKNDKKFTGIFSNIYQRFANSMHEHGADVSGLRLSKDQDLSQDAMNSMLMSAFLEMFTQDAISSKKVLKQFAGKDGKIDRAKLTGAMDSVWAGLNDPRTYSSKKAFTAFFNNAAKLGVVDPDNLFGGRIVDRLVSQGIMTLGNDQNAREQIAKLLGLKDASVLPTWDAKNRKLVGGNLDQLDLQNIGIDRIWDAINAINTKYSFQDKNGKTVTAMEVFLRKKLPGAARATEKDIGYTGGMQNPMGGTGNGDLNAAGIQLIKAAEMLQQAAQSLGGAGGNGGGRGGAPSLKPAYDKDVRSAYEKAISKEEPHWTSVSSLVSGIYPAYNDKYGFSNDWSGFQKALQKYSGPYYGYSQKDFEKLRNGFVTFAQGNVSGAIVEAYQLARQYQADVLKKAKIDVAKATSDDIKKVVGFDINEYDFSQLFTGKNSKNKGVDRFFEDVAALKGTKGTGHSLYNKIYGGDEHGIYNVYSTNMSGLSKMYRDDAEKQHGIYDLLGARTAQQIQQTTQMAGAGSRFLSAEQQHTGMVGDKLVGGRTDLMFLDKDGYIKLIDTKNPNNKLSVGNIAQQLVYQYLAQQERQYIRDKALVPGTNNKLISWKDFKSQNADFVRTNNITSDIYKMLGKSKGIKTFISGVNAKGGRKNVQIMANGTQMNAAIAKILDLYNGIGTSDKWSQDSIMSLAKALTDAGLFGEGDIDVLQNAVRESISKPKPDTSGALKDEKFNSLLKERFDWNKKILQQTLMMSKADKTNLELYEAQANKLDIYKKKYAETSEAIQKILDKKKDQDPRYAKANKEAKADEAFENGLEGLDESAAEAQRKKREADKRAKEQQDELDKRRKEYEKTAKEYWALRSEQAKNQQKIDYGEPGEGGRKRDAYVQRGTELDKQIQDLDKQLQAQRAGLQQGFNLSDDELNKIQTAGKSDYDDTLLLLNADKAGMFKPKDEAFNEALRQRAALNDKIIQQTITLKKLDTDDETYSAQQALLELYQEQYDVLNNQIQAKVAADKDADHGAYFVANYHANQKEGQARDEAYIEYQIAEAQRRKVLAKEAEQDKKDNLRDFTQAVRGYAGVTGQAYKLKRQKDLSVLPAQKAAIDTELDRLSVSASEYSNTIEDLQSKLLKLGVTQEQINGILKQGESQYQRSKNATDIAAKGATNLWEQLGNTLRQMVATFFQMNAAYRIIGMIRNALQKIVQTAKELDKVMTNLRVVTGANRQDAQKLMTTYASLAQQLSATTSEVAASANEWLRQGYSVSETNELISSTMKLSVLGMMNSADATKALTSAMKGFKLEASGALSIVDKFTSLDMNAATSAGDIATALARFATTANQSGVDINSASAMATTIMDVTQGDAGSTGSALRTIFSRYGNVKAGAFTKMGQGDSDDTTEKINDVERVLDALGIQLRTSAHDMRSFGDVLDDIAAKWDNLDEVSKNAIATAMAGTRQREQFAALMENYDKYKDLTEVAKNSNGTADEKYKAYQDSLEASQKRLQAAFEELATNTDVAEFLKTVNNIATYLVKALPIIIRYLTRIIAVANAYKMPAIFQGMMNFFGPKGGLGSKMTASGQASGYLKYNEGGQETFSDKLFGKFTQPADKAAKALDRVADAANKAADAEEKQNKQEAEASANKPGGKNPNEPIDPFAGVSGKNKFKGQVFGFYGGAIKEVEKKLEQKQDLPKKIKDNQDKLSAATAELKDLEDQRLDDPDIDESNIGEINSQIEAKQAEIKLLQAQQAELQAAQSATATPEQLSRLKAQKKASVKTKAAGAAAAGISGFLTAPDTAMNYSNGQVQEMSDAAKWTSKITTGLAGAIGAIWGPLVSQIASTIMSLLNKFLIGPLIDKKANERAERVHYAETLISQVSNLSGTVSRLYDFAQKNILTASDLKELDAAIEDFKSQLLSGENNELLAQINDYLRNNDTGYSSVYTMMQAYENGDQQQRREIAQLLVAATNGAKAGAQAETMANTLYNKRDALDKKRRKIFASDDTTGQMYVDAGLGQKVQYSSGYANSNAYGTNVGQEDNHYYTLSSLNNASTDEMIARYQKLRDEYEKRAAEGTLNYTTMVSQIDDILADLQEIKAIEEESYNATNDIAIQTTITRAKGGKNNKRIEDMTTMELKNLGPEGLINAIASDMQNRGVDLAGHSLYESDGTLSEYARERITESLKQDPRYSAVLSGQAYTLRDVMKMGEGEQKESLISDFANALGLTPDGIKQYADSLLSDFGDLTLGKILQTPAETRQDVEELAGLFESINSSTGMTAQNIETIVSKYPSLIKYIGDQDGMNKQLIEDLESYKKLYAKQTVSSVLNSESAFGVYTDDVMGGLSQDQQDKLRGTKFGNATTMKEIMPLLTANDEQLRNWFGLGANDDLSSAKEIQKVLNDKYDAFFKNMNTDQIVDQQIGGMMSDYMQKQYDKQIQNLQDQKKALEEINKQREYENKLIEARNKLEDAQKQKKRVWREGVGWVYESDQSAVEEAQKTLDETEGEKKTSSIDAQIEQLQAEADALKNLPSDAEFERMSSAYKEWATAMGNLSGSLVASAAKIGEIYAGKSTTGGGTDQSGTPTPSGAKAADEIKETGETTQSLADIALSKLMGTGDYEGKGLVDQYNNLMNKDSRANADVNSKDYADWQKEVNDTRKDIIATAKQAEGSSGYASSQDEFDDILNSKEMDNALPNGVLIGKQYYTFGSQLQPGNATYDYIQGDFNDYTGTDSDAGPATETYGWSYSPTAGTKIVNGQPYTVNTEPKKWTMGDLGLSSYKDQTNLEAIMKNSKVKDGTVLVGAKGTHELGVVHNQKLYSLIPGEMPKAANGSYGLPGGMTLLNEEGTEALITPQGTVTAEPSGTGVVPADITKNLWALGEQAPLLSDWLSKDKTENDDNSFNIGVFNMNVQPNSDFDIDSWIQQVKTALLLKKNQG